jgi:hypothetical protein
MRPRAAPRAPAATAEIGRLSAAGRLAWFGLLALIGLAIVVALIFLREGVGE